jgi:hypothetical protein
MAGFGSTLPSATQPSVPRPRNAAQPPVGQGLHRRLQQRLHGGRGQTGRPASGASPFLAQANVTAEQQYCS